MNQWQMIERIKGDLPNIRKRLVRRLLDARRQGLPLRVAEIREALLMLDEYEPLPPEREDPRP